MDGNLIRNFSIIAHIDHGKSTLADRLMERANTVSTRKLRDQMLDSMDLERERGITIKASAVSLDYNKNGSVYTLNLIDTPGHVDFSYEVSRSLSACEGSLLLVDASQGIEAQTLTNVYLAMENDLEIIPVLSKVDLKSARPEEVGNEMVSILGIKIEEVLKVSAKSGYGIDDVFDAIIDRIPPPKGTMEAPLRALIFDSVYDDYRGVIIYLRVVDGSIKVGDTIVMMKTKRSFLVSELGLFKPEMTAKGVLTTGSVGYCIASIKSIHDVHIGDTVTTEKRRAEVALPGYRKPLPMVYCGLYPSNNTDFMPLRDAIEKLWLNDSSFSFSPETSQALGFGFRCGFLGLLHMEIVQERLERESNVGLVQTAPTVTYEILTHNGAKVMVHNPEKLPPVNTIDEFREPMVEAKIILPVEYIGSIMKLASERRSKYIGTEYLSEKRAILAYEMPLGEIIFDFYDKLKSSTRGFGTLDYEFKGYVPEDLVKLDIVVAGNRVDALSCIVHRKKAEAKGRSLVKKLKEDISRHMFEIPIQAAIGGRVVARETIRAMSKNVTAKCYGGDITRKRKLLEKQKEGKKRMKNVGNVEIPQKAFLSVLSTEG
ncbi:MAG: elongation factor 4 [Candidatus Scalindua sp. AMX11]|nr:MAG: elongation factor 4 [Candidatus Scalindua sp.]NOG83220.1 elongation factor 4 [Planctomycetota bacterium]RZV77583.1 MAG: elongation factor 4 [Candidatus Scalindua sp. SCAELEC01]TDE64538.1 MAG: elongation factor 4 [Candidatus Scalindua sp. AMX11]GJQ58651.1 MAG: elongation factor 4 [Candidatus Scalindua sp.]